MIKKKGSRPCLRNTYMEIHLLSKSENFHDRQILEYEKIFIDTKGLYHKIKWK